MQLLDLILIQFSPLHCLMFCFSKVRFSIDILFTTASRPALGPTQLPIQWVSGDLSWG